QIRSLVAAGAGAGIGAAFNAPIAGMLFALEVILSSFAVRHMSSIVIASIAAAITSRSLVGPELALDTGFYRMTSFAELVPYAGLAIVVVVVGLLFLALIDRLEDFSEKHGASLGWMRPVAAGLIVAAIVFFGPQLFGTGQLFPNELLAGRATEAGWPRRLRGLGQAVATARRRPHHLVWRIGWCLHAVAVHGCRDRQWLRPVGRSLLDRHRLAQPGSVRGGRHGRDVLGRRACPPHRHPHRLRGDRGSGLRLD